VEQPQSFRDQTFFFAKKLELRRDESIIMEALQAQRPVHQRLPEIMIGALRYLWATATDELFGYLRWAFAPTRGVRTSTLETSMRPKNAILRVMPWLLAAGLVIALVVRSGDKIQTPTADLVSVASAAPAALPEVGPKAPEMAPSVVDTIDNPANAAPKSSVRRIMPIRSALFVSPSAKSVRAVQLKPGSEIQIYPEYPAPDGWVLARRPGAEIGFVPAAHLEGKPAAGIDPPVAPPRPAVVPHVAPRPADPIAHKPAPAAPKAHSGELTADDLLAGTHSRSRGSL
jgi:hypothetical protein